jgi:hypothetical protein
MEHVEGISLYDYSKQENFAGRFLPENEVVEIIR